MIGNHGRDGAQGSGRLLRVWRLRRLGRRGLRLGDRAPALDGTGEVVIDLAGLTFIDSSGVRTLGRLSQRIGGGIVLRYPRDAVIRIFELLQIDEMPGIRLIRN